MKKITAFLVCVLLSISVSTSFAVNSAPERVTLEVDTIEDVKAFYNSPEYDSNKQYSFLLKYPITNSFSSQLMRAGCPNCGGAGWTGSGYRVDERDVIPEGCPSYPGLAVDLVVVFRYTYVERCRLCGFERPHDEHYFVVTCQYTEAFFPDFEAWNGQSYLDGYDMHADKTCFPRAYKKYPW